MVKNRKLWRIENKKRRRRRVIKFFSGKLLLEKKLLRDKEKGRRRRIIRIVKGLLLTRIIDNIVKTEASRAVINKNKCTYIWYWIKKCKKCKRYYLYFLIIMNKRVLTPLHIN